MTPEEMHESLPVHLRRQRPDGTYYAMGLISRMQQDLEDLTQGKRAATYPEVDEYLGYALLAEGLAPRELSAPEAVKWWRAGGSEVLSERPNNAPLLAVPDAVHQSARPHVAIDPSVADGRERPASAGGSPSPTQISFIGHPLMASVNGKIDLATLSGADMSRDASMGPVAAPAAGFGPNKAFEALSRSYKATARPRNSKEDTDKATRGRLLNSAGLLDLQRKRSLGLATQDPYSPANLNLGVNQQYDDTIVMASWKYGLAPQTLAAFIGAEARRNSRNEWDPKSKNSDTGASGLTQFVATTWIGEAERRGSYLNEVAQRLGYLDRNGKMKEDHKKDFLELRFDTDHSIYAAADYASYNIAALRARKMILDESPAAIARYAYIAHHEGLDGARRFFGGQPVKAAHWYENVPQEKRKALLAANGQDRDAAYRAFMNRYTDERIDVTLYMYDPANVTPPATQTLHRKARR
ncbi:hypothetical protein U1769_01350 [Sphingomonas sp. ZT3P38]|uniref:hypothetical protein n=1 Tax=Parasphingomonas zepuensis TaxID=3096161 RepID=UPI002FC78983